MLKIIKMFWAEGLAIIVAGVIVTVLVLTNLQSFIIDALSTSVSFVALYRSYKSFFSAEKITKFDYYQKLKQALKEDNIITAIKKWEEVSKIYFTRDTEDYSIIQEAFKWADCANNLNINQKVQYIDSYVSNEINLQMRAYSDKYAPIFDFVVDVYEYWKYDILPEKYVRALFDKKQLKNLLKYGSYYLYLSKKHDDDEHYKEAITKLAEVVGCPIWNTEIEVQRYYNSSFLTCPHGHE